MADPHQSDSRPHGLLGSVSLLLGIILLALRGVERIRSLPGMPRFWQEQATLWWGMGLALVAFGAWILARVSTRKSDHGWQPSEPGQRFQELQLYTRAGCHLCDEAREILEDHSRWLPAIVECDIEQDPHLLQQYQHCIPVVALDGKERFQGKVSVELLRRLIEATPPANRR